MTQIRGNVAVVGPIEIAHERPWATLMRVPVASGDVWFKAWVPSQALSPLFSRVSLSLSGCPLSGPRGDRGEGPRDDPQGRRPGSGPKVSLVPLPPCPERWRVGHTVRGRSVC